MLEKRHKSRLQSSGRVPLASLMSYLKLCISINPRKPSKGMLNAASLGKPSVSRLQTSSASPPYFRSPDSLSKMTKNPAHCS